MNAERLHAVANEVNRDLLRGEIPAVMAQLSEALQSRVREPAQPAYVQQVGDLRTRLRTVLSQSKTNEFSDAWRLVLEEMGVWDILGSRLSEQLEAVFTRNEITPDIAAAEVAAINTRVSELKANLDRLLPALVGLKIGAEDLEPGEFELGFLIPRGAVDNGLENLGREFTELNAILLPLMELVDGRRPQVQVRSISSSDFQVSVGAWAQLALTVANIVDRLLNSYERIRTIRGVKDQLESAGVSEDFTAQLGVKASEMMRLDIEKLATELVEGAAKQLPPGREHELKVEIKHSISKIATRIDEGYSIEVRTSVTATDDAVPDGDTPADDLMVARRIAEMQPRMRRMNLTGKPILELPDGDVERGNVG